MTTEFRFPLSYVESMLPQTNPTDLPGTPATADQEDHAKALVALLNSLESQSVPPPPRVGAFQNIAGSLGDAIGAMAAVRAGGQPPAVGPFAANLRQRQMAYEKESQAAQAANIETRNKVRIGAFEDEMRAQREKEVASIRRAQTMRALQQKTFYGKDTSGRPVSVPFNYNPNLGTLSPIPGYESGFERYVRPFLAQGINTETGDAEFRMIEPFPEQTGGTGNAGTRNFEPLPPPGLAAEAGGKAGVVGRFPEIMKLYNEAADSVGGSEGKLRQVFNWARSKGAKTTLGPVVAPEPLVNYYRSVRSVLFPIVKAGSGMVFPEAELRRWEARFPIPGVDTPDEAEHAWEVLTQEMITDIKAKYGAAGRTPPQLPEMEKSHSGISPTGQEWLKKRGLTVTP